MAARGPILLFIGREPNGDLAWRQVRRLCQPGRALRASDAYHGLAILLKNPQLSLTVVDVDHLSDSEMSFFSAVRRQRPQLHLLALGRGNELSNSRLAQATWEGASEAVATERLQSRLSELMGLEQTYIKPSPSAQTFVRQALLDTAPSVEPKPAAQQTTAVEGFQSLLKSRTVSQAKRKAPATEPPAKKTPRQTQDVVTPEELRVLLGSDDDRAQEPDDRKEKKGKKEKKQ